MGPNEKIMALLGSLLVLLLSKKKTIDFKPCRDNSPYANPLIVQLSPNPLLIQSGAEINVNVYANLLKPLEPGSKVKLHLKEKKLWFDVTIPCLIVDGKKVGSCEYDLQYLLDMAKDHMKKQICQPPFMPQGQGCQVPLKPGVYGGQKNSTISITLPPIPEIIAPFLSGRLSAKAELKGPHGDPRVCLQASFEIDT